MRKLLAAVVLSVVALPACAVGTLVPAANRVDMVHDDSRGLIYISSGTQLLRYDVATATFLSPLELGGSLGGIDISPDNRQLVVAERTGSATQSWVYLVDLANWNFQSVAVDTPDIYEAGIYTAVYDNNGRIYTTSTFNGSGDVPLRRLDPATGTWTSLATVRHDTMLSASGDGETIGFAENGASNGPWGLIDVPTGTVVRRDYTGNTGHYNYEIALDRLGAQFSLPTYWGTFVYNDAYSLLGTLGVPQGGSPIGGAYHPVERIAYFPFEGTSQVRVFDMSSRTQTSTLNFEYVFGSNGNHAFQFGRTHLSRDGSLLMVSVGGGVRILEQYAPLQANSASGTTYSGQTTAISLPASIGNGGSISYVVGFPAAHGTVSIAGNVATYTPAPGYIGSDFFTYLARYGRAIRSATVSVTVVQPPNAAPVAVNDTAQTRNTAILIPVLANDSDPDGDTLSLVSVTVPTAGSAVIQGTKVLFTPPKSWPKSAITLSYTLSDGRGKTASAQVSVTRN